MVLIYAPFVLQALAMMVDEFYFHQKRTLPKWERIGHPLDTLTVLACLFWLLLVVPTATTVGVYVGLSIFSSVFILKDEPIHRRVCESIEHGLHVLLFTLHPLVLISAGLLWPALHADTASAFPLVRFAGWERPFFLANLTVIVLFLVYQTVYWNFLWPVFAADKQRHLSKSPFPVPEGLE